MLTPSSFLDGFLHERHSPLCFPFANVSSRTFVSVAIQSRFSSVEFSLSHRYRSIVAHKLALAATPPSSPTAIYLLDRDATSIRKGILQTFTLRQHLPRTSREPENCLLVLFSQSAPRKATLFYSSNDTFIMPTSLESSRPIMAPSVRIDERGFSGISVCVALTY